MKIDALTLYKVAIPMTTSFTTSFGIITSKPTAIVRAETDKGYVGWGEAAALPFPYYIPDTTDLCCLVLEQYIAPLVLHRDFNSVDDLMDALQCIKQHTFAKTAIENAALMILSLETKQPLKELLGGVRDRIAVGESVGIKRSIQATIDEVAMRLAEGYRRIKLKVAPEWDINVVRAVREHFGDIELMVDGNSSYTLADVATLRKLDAYNLTMIEQPLAYDDIVDHSVLQRQLSTPICLDESIRSVDDARRAVHLSACRIINIKPGRVGGLLEGRRIHDLCSENDMGVWCGGMFETGIGRAFNVALASLQNFVYPADMSPMSQYFEADLVTDGFVVDEHGYVAVSGTPGLGYEVDEDAIACYTTMSRELT